jgi:hypothetical protein
LKTKLRHVDFFTRAKYVNEFLKIISITGAIFCLGKRIDYSKELQAAADVFKVFDTSRGNCINNNNNNNNDHGDFYGDASDYDKGRTLEAKKVVERKRDRTFPPGCKPDLRSFGMLRSVVWWLGTDVLGQNLDSIFKGQAVLGLLAH